MYWPPRWTNNNTVTIDDAKFVFDGLGAERFAPFTQAACFLSPWLSWAGVDTPWVASDPMCRVLLIGDPPAALLSLNNSATGAIIYMGNPPFGAQAWEVVSFFDWYDETSGAAKVGSMAWCRLWPDYVGPTPPAALSILWADRQELGVAAPSFDFSIPPGADGLIVVFVVVIVAGGGGVDVADCDGVAMTGRQELHPPDSTDISMWCFTIPVLAGDAGDFHYEFGEDVECQIFTFLLQGATGPDATSWTNFGVGTAPTAVAISETTDEAICLSFCVAKNPAVGLTFDAPLTNVLIAAGPNADGWTSRCGSQISIPLIFPGCDLSTCTADEWAIIGLAFVP